jgi:hypothetical protein
MKTLISKFTIPTTVILVLFLIKLMNPVFYDPDFYWHLKTGEYMVSHLSIPSTDPFSYTAAGKPWVAHEWLTELILYGVDRYAGFFGIRMLVAGLLCATFVVLYRFARKMVANDNHALIISLVFFAPLMPFASPRPQAFSFLLFALLLCILLEYKYFNSTRKFIVIPFLMLAWVNLHGAYVVGFALLATFTATEWICQRAAAAAGEPRTPNLRKLLAMIALSALVANLNPHGLQVWTHPFYLMSMEASKDVIVEWQSPNFHSVYYQCYLLLISAYYIGLAYCRRKPDLTEIALPTLFIVAGMVSQRHLPLASFTLLALASVMYPRIEWPANPFAKPSRGAISKTTGKQISPALVVALNLGLIAAVATSVFASKARARNDEHINQYLPVRAAEYVIEHKLSGNMFNDYGDGGYLIYRLAPDRKVFIDGRADMYGDSFINEYLEISNGGPGWKEKFDKLNIDYVICGKATPLHQLLLANGSFEEVYADKFRAVLTRTSGNGSAAMANADIPPRSSRQ